MSVSTAYCGVPRTEQASGRLHFGFSGIRKYNPTHYKKHHLEHGMRHIVATLLQRCVGLTLLPLSGSDVPRRESWQLHFSAHGRCRMQRNCELIYSHPAFVSFLKSESGSPKWQQLPDPVLCELSFFLLYGPRLTTNCAFHSSARVCCMLKESGKLSIASPLLL